VVARHCHICLIDGFQSKKGSNKHCFTSTWWRLCCARHRHKRLCLRNSQPTCADVANVHLGRWVRLSAKVTFACHGYSDAISWSLQLVIQYILLILQMHQQISRAVIMWLISIRNCNHIWGKIFV